MDKIHFVILTWNSEKVIGACIDSLLAFRNLKVAPSTIHWRLLQKEGSRAMVCTLLLLQLWNGILVQL